MTKKELITEILKTYDEEMTKKYGAWLKRQPKSQLESILEARTNK